eukprot:scaffold106524_cov38-Prasinocladus_malaysianus.AAC.1
MLSWEVSGRGNRAGWPRRYGRWICPATRCEYWNTARSPTRPARSFGTARSCSHTSCTTPIDGLTRGLSRAAESSSSVGVI